MITIRQLLNHRSGLPGIEGGYINTDHYSSDLEVIQKTFGSEVELACKPGEEYNFTPLGYTLLSLAISDLSSYSLPELLSYFNSCTEMGDTKSGIILERPGELVMDRSGCYDLSSGKVQRSPYVDYSYSYAGLGMMCSPDDLMRVGLLLANVVDRMNEESFLDESMLEMIMSEEDGVKKGLLEVENLGFTIKKRFVAREKPAAPETPEEEEDMKVADLDGAWQKEEDYVRRWRKYKSIGASGYCAGAWCSVQVGDMILDTIRNNLVLFITTLNNFPADSDRTLPSDTLTTFQVFPRPQAHGESVVVVMMCNAHSEDASRELEELAEHIAAAWGNEISTFSC